MSPIAQMERLHHPIHAGFGRPLEGARAFYFKSLSICVICVIGGFNSLFQVHGCTGEDATGAQTDQAESSASRTRRASSRSRVPVERRIRRLVKSGWWTVKWHHQIPWLFQRWWSGLFPATRMEACMASVSTATHPEGSWKDEGRRSDDETTAFKQESYFWFRLSPAHRKPLPVPKAPCPQTQGRSLVVGISPRRHSGCVSFRP